MYDTPVKPRAVCITTVPNYPAALLAAGLEFRDVLLFNFFSDSPAKNEWRVVLEQVLHPYWSKPVGHTLA
jgi:hypothetical protein